MTTLDAVRRQWREQGIQVNPGASEAELTRLETFVGVVLPQDVRDYFAAMNGMPEDRATSGLTWFWPIERIVDQPQLNAGIDELGEFRVDFGCCSLCNPAGSFGELPIDMEPTPVDAAAERPQSLLSG
jgi:hypothetical protein